MFSDRVYRLEALREAMATYATGAAEKLREQRSLCSTLLVSVQTGQHEPEERGYYRSLGIQLAHPTDDTRILVQAALPGWTRSIARVTPTRRALWCWATSCRRPLIRGGRCGGSCCRRRGKL
ncbi:DinB/UmuC family translesion DNA polymerase [Pseudomonas sp. SHLB1]|uniref:DinB/UmuC family translesion DNA polymerase n=1 Tax=unclassified Pseudomonas TaxID=196821 RepID=UPI003FCF6EE1